MWDELNRWWHARRRPGQPPPEQIVIASPPELQNRPDPPAGERVAELENALAAARQADTSQQTNACEPNEAPACIEPGCDQSQSHPRTTYDSPPGPSPEHHADFDAADCLDQDDDSPYASYDELGSADAGGGTHEHGADLATAPDDLETFLAGPLGGRPTRVRGRRLTRPELERLNALTPQQRLAILDCWRRSGLPAKDFAPLVGVSRHTLYAWKQRFERLGAAGFPDEPRGAKKGSRLPDATRRAILALKASQPDWGCERISNMLLRSSALPASPAAVARVLHDAGYELHESPTRPHPDHPRHFERARPNQLWQTDLFIDWYNFQRVHSAIGGLVPADRYFHAAPEVARTLKQHVAANAIELARHGVPKPPFYLTGQVGGRNFSLHAEGPRVFLTPVRRPASGGRARAPRGHRPRRRRNAARAQRDPATAVPGRLSRGDPPERSPGRARD
jgi:transposase